MKYSISSLLVFLFSLAIVACDNDREEFLSEYNTILYFLDSGELPLTVYDVGEDTNYKVTVVKGGADVSSSGKVDVVLMSNQQLEAYNNEHSTNYVMLPENCFGFNNQSVTISGQNSYQALDVVLKTNLINSLPVIEGKYVLPIALENSTDSINSEKKSVFLMPNILTPKVFFEDKMNDDVVFTADDAATIAVSIPVSLPSDLENRWDFSCDIEIAEDQVAWYNGEYGMQSILLPAEAFSMSSKAEFASGEINANISVEINRSNLPFGNYVLPIKLAACSKPEIKIDEDKKVYLVPISYTPPVPPQITLTADMLSTNAQEAYEGPLADIVDGNKETFFHSSWSAAFYSPYGHYIDVALNDPINLVQFYYTTRHNNANGAPKEIILYGSNDGETWEQIANVNRGLPQEVAAEYTSQVYQANSSFTKLRIAVKESAGGKMNETESAWFAMGELKLFGQQY